MSLTQKQEHIEMLKRKPTARFHADVQDLHAPCPLLSRHSETLTIERLQAVFHACHVALAALLPGLWLLTGLEAPPVGVPLGSRCFCKKLLLYDGWSVGTLSGMQT